MPERSTHPESRPRGGSRGLELLVGSALCAFLFVVYISSPAGKLWDSQFALLTSEAILEGEGFDLSRFLAGTAWEGPTENDPAVTMPWQLERVQGRLLYVFPPGTSVLSLPLVAALRAGGVSTLDGAYQYSRSRERRMQLLAASFLSALTAVVALRLARREVALLPALAIALLAGLGSSLWTVASRELWSHTWSALLLGAGWLELLRWEEQGRKRPWLLGAIASAAFWVRPSNAWIALAWTVFVALRHRSQTLRMMVSGAFGLAAYCAWSLTYSGGLLPTYIGMNRPWSARTFLPGLAESLFSTHHGLLVYSPILLAVAYVLLRHGVPESRRPLAVLGSVLLLGHLGLHAAAGAVWGPDGPRLQHDLVPLLAWFGALALRRLGELDALGAPGTPPERLEAPRRKFRPGSALLTASLATASILASIGSVHVERQTMWHYRARLEASYPKWDPRRLPQYLGLRALAGADFTPPKRPHKKRR